MYLRQSLLYSVLLLMLAGCASSPLPVPKAMLDWQAPRQVLVTETSFFKGAEKSVVWLVVMQQQGDSLRWLRFNLLGAPDSRQILQNGKWRNDGFIPPNKEARELFAALLFAWTPLDDVERAYSFPSNYLLFVPDNKDKKRRFIALRGNHALCIRMITCYPYPIWEIEWQNWPNQPDRFSIKEYKSGITWQVRPLEN